VAGELERRWNERLVAIRDLELEIDRLDADEAPALTVADRERLMALGRDLLRAWESPGTTPETRKKIIRTVISEIIVDIVGDNLELIAHWESGDHTRLIVKRNRAGQTRWTTDVEIVDLVRALARQMPDQTIAALLNRSGKSTGRGNSWTRGRSRRLPRRSRGRGAVLTRAGTATRPPARRRSVNDQDQKIIRAKVGLLELAKQLGDTVLAAQTRKDDADLLLCGKLPPGGTADLLDMY
jgi:hypothetical protein